MRNGGSAAWLAPTNLIALLAVIVTVILGATTIKATYDLYDKGATPPKSLKATYRSAVDPLTDLRRASDQFTVTVESGREQLDNLQLRQAILVNDGKSPILPSDIVEPLSIRTKAPWRIVSVVDATGESSSAVQLQWERVSSTEFRAAKALLNPGDYIALTIYLTDTSKRVSTLTDENSGVGNEKNESEKPEPPIEWRARIVNLSKINTPPKQTADDLEAKLDPFPIIVMIWGWGIPFVVASFSCFFLLYITTLYQLGALSRGMVRCVIALLPAGVISLMAAEAGTSYVFGAFPFEGGEVPHLLNAPLVTINAIALIGLVAATLRRSRRAASSERAANPETADFGSTGPS